MTHMFKGMLIAFLTIVIASATYAFASSSSFPTARGEGAGAVSGYSVSNVTYQFNADPTRIDSVSFLLDGQATSVKVKLSDTATTWYACTAQAGNAWTCRTDGALTQSAETLRVFASGN
jgi:hypothetical protein